MFVCLPSQEWTGRLGLNNWTEALIKTSILSTPKTQHQLNACAKVHGYLSYLENLSQPAETGAKNILFSHLIAYFVQLVSEYFPLLFVFPFNISPTIFSTFIFLFQFSTFFNVGHSMVVGEESFMLILFMSGKIYIHIFLCDIKLNNRWKIILYEFAIQAF